MRRDTMKRWLVRICVLVLLGAIVNVAVAWGLAYWKRAHAPSLTLLDDATTEPMLTRAFPQWTSDESWSTSGAVFVSIGISRRHALALDKAAGRFLLISKEQSGLPSLSMRGETIATEVARTTNHGWPIGGELFVELIPGLFGSVIPGRPIWPGFAINTVFYAAILWVLFAAPFALRRWRRIKRGLCPKCGYDLRGSATTNACPECGVTVTLKPTHA
jgi:hypothetical protein